MYFQSFAAFTALSAVGVMAVPTSDLVTRAETNTAATKDVTTKFNFHSQSEFDQNFKTYGGKWTVSGSSVVIKDDPKKPGAKAALKTPLKGDYTYSAKVAITDNLDTQGKSGNAGILFSARSLDVGIDRYDGWYAGYNIFSTPPVLVIGKATASGGQDGTWTPIKSIPVESVNKDEFHEIKVVAKTVTDKKTNAKKGEIEIYVRGKIVHTLTEDPQKNQQTEPQAGFRVFKAGARFDDVKVTDSPTGQSSSKSSENKDGSSTSSKEKGTKSTPP